MVSTRLEPIAQTDVPDVEPPQEVRIDKWLWATRVFKTRSLAIAACKAGHVKIAGQRIKPARTVRIGQTITVQLGELTRTVKVLGLLENRVGAALAKQCQEDLTPAVEYEKLKTQRVPPLFARPKGLGRPTKKERRLLDRMRGAAPL
jgi:ribosome-associated heat shock protein Hsp15